MSNQTKCSQPKREPIACVVHEASCYKSSLCSKLESPNYSHSDSDKPSKSDNVPSINLLKRKSEALDGEKIEEAYPLSKLKFRERFNVKDKKTMYQGALSCRKVSDLSRKVVSELSRNRSKSFLSTASNKDTELLFLRSDEVDGERSQIYDSENVRFPELPIAVSETSCCLNNDPFSSGNVSNKKSRCLSDDGNAMNKSISKASYGWFVELDDCYNSRDEVQGVAQETFTSATFMDQTLAFAVPIPKNVITNKDQEVVWAQAADTVDSIFDDLEF